MGNIFQICNNQSQVLNTINSINNNLTTQRENMATWYRVNIAVTDVYEIIKTLGEGRMGEVYHVRRKDGGRTHTEATKRKEEEMSLQSGIGASYSKDDLDDTSSRGSKGSTGSYKKNGKNSLDNSSRSFTGLIIGGIGSLDNSGSGHGGTKQLSESLISKLRNKLKDKKQEAAVSHLNMIDVDMKSLYSIPPDNIKEPNLEINSNNNNNTNEFKARKEPPDLNKYQKPKGILRKPKHGSTPHLPSLDTERTQSKGMTSLVIGTSLMSDDEGNDSDESIPMNMNAISQDPTSSTNSTPTLPKPTPVSNACGACDFSGISTADEPDNNDDDGDDNSNKNNEKVKIEVRPTFLEDGEDESMMSGITQNEDDDEDGEKETSEFSPRSNRQRQDSIVTGDDPKDQNKKEIKKWVPRRRVFFRRHYACKTLHTENIKKGQMEELMNEIYMMRKMDHPYIIRLYEVYQVDQKIWLVMDLCGGGDLHSRRLDEQRVTVVAEQILRGVAYLHRRGICHRDLKMENILYETNKSNSTIRLIDFGLSLTYDQINPKQKYVGAAYTLSPEVLKKQPYTEKSDVWSIGVIIWIMLAGDYPFIKEYDDLKDELLKKKLLNAEYTFGITWRGRGISEHAKNFVRGCLRCDPTERWSALEALEYMQDQWIPFLEEQAKKDALSAARLLPPKKEKKQKRDSYVYYTKERLPPPETIAATLKKRQSLLLDKHVLADIKRYAQYSLFKKTILVTVANTMDHKDVGIVSELFLMIDTNQSGTISLPELKAVLNKADEDSNEKMSDENIEKLFSAIDYDGSGDIHYAEFIAAFAESQGLITIDRLEDSFDRIDRQGKGFISHDDLHYILGGNYSKETVDEMIKEGDFNKNGQIDFDEFVQLMIGDD